MHQRKGCLNYWGWGWGRLKREFYKKGKRKGGVQQKRNGGSAWTTVRWRRDGKRGEICEIRDNRVREELFLDQCDREGEGKDKKKKEIVAEWMKKLMCIWEEMQESREYGCRDEGWWKQRTGHYSVNLSPLWIDPVIWLATHWYTHTHTQGQQTLNLHWFDWGPVQSYVALLFTSSVYSTSHTVSHTHTLHSRIHLDSSIALQHVHVANTTIYQPYRIYKFRALIL